MAIVPERMDKDVKRSAATRAPKLGTGSYDLDDLYRRYSAFVLRRALCFVSRADAEELAHEVFLKLLEAPERFTGASSPTTWLYTVTTRLCIDHLRGNTRHEALILKNSATLWNQIDPGTTPEARAFLGALWKKLDPELTMIGVLYHLDGLTTAQIGAMLGVSDRTIATRLDTLTQRARTLAEEAP